MKIQIVVLCGPERHSWICPELVEGLVSWPSNEVRQLAYRSAFAFSTSQEARNDACDRLLESDFDGLLMIDNDTVPINPKTEELVDLPQMAEMGLDIVAAPVPTTKYDNWLINAYMHHQDEEGHGWRSISIRELTEPEPDRIKQVGLGQPQAVPVVKVDAVGFGAVYLSRKVIQAVRESGVDFLDSAVPRSTLPKSSYWLDRITQPRIFDPQANGVTVTRNRGPRGNTICGEDLLFCRRALHLGFQPYVSPTHYCGHYHTVDYARLPQMKYALTTPVDYGIKGPCPEPSEWSIEPQLAKWLRKTILSCPGKVLELGSGVSTLLMAYALSDAYGPHSRDNALVSLEHDSDWHAKMVDYISKNHLMVEYLHCPLVTNAAGPDSDIKQAGFYQLDHRFPTDYQFGLMLIDGPKAAEAGEDCRWFACYLFDLISQGGLIVLDDADRVGEARAMADWIKRGMVELVERIGRAAILRKL